MRIPGLIVLIFSCLGLAGCGPMAAVGMVGNMVNRSIQKAEDQAYAESGGVPGQQTETVSQSYDRQAIADANIRLGVAYLQNQQYRLALDKFSRARIAKPDYALSYSMLGVLYHRIEDYELAEQNFKKSLDLDPGNSDTLNNYGLYLCDAAKYEAADQAFLEAAGNPLNNKPEIALANAGTCAMQQGNVVMAEDYFHRSLDRNPAVGPALLQMSRISFDKGEYTDARSYLNRYLAISEHTSSSLWLGIQIENQLGDKDTVSSYALLLRNQYSESEEARLLEQSGIH